jgi:hypothetical protein
MSEKSHHPHRPTCALGTGSNHDMMMVQSEVMAMPGSGFGEGFELDSPDFWFFFFEEEKHFEMGYLSISVLMNMYGFPYTTSLSWIVVSRTE